MAYVPLFNIVVGHEFFASERCMGIDFVATSNTEKFIRNAGLLVRNTGFGVSVVYDSDKTEALKRYADDEDDRAVCEFKVYSRDLFFKSYTEAANFQSDSILYFDNLRLGRRAANRLKLHKSKYATNLNVKKLDTIQIRSMFSQKNRLIPPVFVVKICITDRERTLFEGQTNAAANYYIGFNTRQSVWKYCLLGAMARNGVFVFDLDQQMEFRSGVKAPLAGDKNAVTIMSKKAIPLRDSYDFRFQLREKISGREKILIKRLPVASVSQTDKTIVSGQEVMVSEIYVNF